MKQCYNGVNPLMRVYVTQHWPNFDAKEWDFEKHEEPGVKEIDKMKKQTV